MTQGLNRGLPSHEDVFSVVGGMELNRNASARDLPAETSKHYIRKCDHASVQSLQM